MKPFISISLLTAGFLLLSFSPGNFIAGKVGCVFIDIGHGGKDPGALGVSNSLEKDVAFGIGTQVGSLIKVHMPDVKYRYTRYGDEFISLEERARMANKEGADFFISIHANASSDPNIRGTETFVMGLSAAKENAETVMRENRFFRDEGKRSRKLLEDSDDPDLDFILARNRQSFIHKRSIRMAELIETYSKNRAINRFSRGVKSANLLVLYKTVMPSVLVEVGYITNSEEEKYLQSEEGKYEVASAIYRALRDYKEETEK